MLMMNNYCLVVENTLDEKNHWNSGVLFFSNYVCAIDFSDHLIKIQNHSLVALKVNVLGSLLCWNLILDVAARSLNV